MHNKGKVRAFGQSVERLWDVVSKSFGEWELDIGGMIDIFLTMNANTWNCFGCHTLFFWWVLRLIALAMH